MNYLLLHAMAAFLVLPGMVAFVIPLAWIAPGGPERFGNPVGLVPLAIGVAVLISCVREFYVSGRGTLAPWAPPRTLVVTGLYRYSRNPMYLGVLLILSGWAVGFRTWPLAVYAGGAAIVFHIRVVLFEEPWLARIHDAQWASYSASVPRWIGRAIQHAPHHHSY